MSVRRIRTWEELEALPKGKWVEIGGIDFEVVDEAKGPRRPARVVIPLAAKVARSLRPLPGEVLEAKVKGRSLELVRRRARPKKSARA
jgi:hypothetical protein